MTLPLEDTSAPPGIELVEIQQKLETSTAFDFPVSHYCILARELIALDTQLSSSQACAMLLLLVCVWTAAENGDTAIDISTIIQGDASTNSPLSILLLALALPKEAAANIKKDIESFIIPPYASALVGAPSHNKPLCIDNGFLYIKKLWQFETQLCQQIFLRNKVSLAAEEDIAPSSLVHSFFETNRENKEGSQLSDEQKRAAIAALRHNTTVITGGPGTGKTFLAATILRLYASKGVQPYDIALAAPTGKAANRLQEAIHAALGNIDTPTNTDNLLIHKLPKATTLHSLLGIGPSGFPKKNSSNPLHRKLVIVDESSMIDSEQAKHLFDALSVNTHCVLMGDANQLPSIGAGSVLYDIVHSQVVPAYSLSHNFRSTKASAQSPGHLAMAIREGTLQSSQIVNDQESPFTCLLNSQKPQQNLQAWKQFITTQNAITASLQTPFVWKDQHCDINDTARLSALFDWYQRHRILCVTNKGPMGTSRVNEMLMSQAFINQQVNAPVVEPILYTKNDPERGLANGDHGFILSVINNGEFPRWYAVLSTPTGMRLFPYIAIKDNIDSAHALTVHKAQGSEFDHVLVILPEKQIPLFSRALLYTAVTRAKRTISFSGSLPQIDYAMQNQHHRISCLSSRLQKTLLPNEQAVVV